MAINNQAEFYLNFQQFGDIKLRAREGSEDAAATVAQQFEGLFVQQMLGAMRAAAKVDSNQHSSYMDTYLDMYDKQLAQIISAQGRLGVADLIREQMPGETAASAQSDTQRLEFPSINPHQAIVASQVLALEAPPAVVAAVRPVAFDTASSGVVVGKVVDDDFAELGGIERFEPRWRHADEFVADIWPQARSAAKSLGVSPELLVAQSALETGWGRHTMKFEDGRDSYNLFGIKAGADWGGQSLQRASLEYSDGALHNQVSRFRAYSSPAQSLDDYVDFIHSNPRYRQALAQAGDDQAYIREIQRAGYATDPDYADKIIGILNGDLLRSSVAAVATGVNRHA